MRKTFFGMLERPTALSLLLVGMMGMTAGAAPAQEAATPAPNASPRAAGAISGRVISLEGEPVTDAQVTLAETRRRASVGADGSFRFAGIAPGEYLVEAASPRLGSAVERVTVTPGGTAEVTLNLDLTIHREEIVVTASPDARSQNEIAQPTSVLDEQELDRQRQPTLGETLNREPGVTSTFFGMGASRPVIRGLGGDRIRILEGGVGVGDASSTSPDHAVSSDPLAAERIEVLRGPATLLYGSSAVGGVVNVIDNRIPERVPEEINGTVELRGGSVADERGGAASVTGGAGRLAWHVDILKRETGDYEIPGFAESRALREAEAEEGEEHEEARGRLPNSATDSEAGTLGVSYIVDGGFFGVSVGGLDSLYGIPGGHEHGHDEEEEHGEEEEGGHAEEAEGEAPVRIDLEQRRLDLRGGVTRPFGVFRGANVRFGRSDYEHQELEGDEVGTLFTNDSWEGRLELLQKRYGPLTGSVGFQALRRDFAAVGEEAFVPPSETDTWAAFTFQELTRGPWRFQLGGRYESQDTSAAAGEVRDRSFDGLSASLGLVWQPVENYTFGLAVARSTKLPNAEELFSNGPHLATNAFELGNPNLREETSLSADLSLRKTAGRVSGEITLFTNRFDDFIYERATGEEEDGLPVFLYSQADAEFRGAELTGVVQLFHTEPHHFDLEVGADFVRAELRETGEPLPRIPPRRYRLGVHYRGERLDGLVEATRVDEQDRVAAFEAPTEGYTTLNANLSYRIFTSRAIYDLLLRGTNLTDEEARNHVSFLKDRVPLPGRDVSLALRLTF